MELALQGLKWITCLIYIDDIIVFGKSFDEHLQRTEQVLERIRAAGLKLKPEKCNMLQSDVIFLGYVVSGEGVSPSRVNIAKILDWPRPKTAKQVKQFVAMESYYRRYVKDFVSKVRPMVELTKKGKRFLWSEACERSFEKLKRALVSSDIMGYPLNDAGNFILDVDPSDVGIGGILQSAPDARVQRASHSLRQHFKQSWDNCITEKKLLAVRFFHRVFQTILTRQKICGENRPPGFNLAFQIKGTKREDS